MFSRQSFTLLGAIFICLLTGTDTNASAASLQGITAPNADITLSFVLPGRVSAVLVKAGSTVEKNQPLANLYDEPEKIQSRQLKMLSEDLTKINAAKAELAQKRVDLKKVRSARDKGAASEWEVEHLRLNVRIAELALQSARLEQKQYRQRHQHAIGQLERMRLISPISGRVEEVNVQVGESIGTLGPVMRIVQNDPLWIDVPVPINQALDLTIGQPAWIFFPGKSTDDASPNAKIINISAVADAASETLQIRIEAPNPLNRPAGERVSVAFNPEQKDNVNAQLEVK